jgi:Outer membrane lipoprotein-sorting protein
MPGPPARQPRWGGVPSGLPRGISERSRRGWGPAASGKSACGHTEPRTANPRRGVSESARRGWGPAASGKNLAWLSLICLLVVPADAADNARQIVEEVQKRTDAKSHRYEGLLQVFDAKGAIADKRWVFERLGSHGNSKSILRFTAPAEVKGVALLVVNHPDRASDQWMWTPAIERDRRIALQDRSTRFFGTDFSFEDLEERDVNQFDYTILGEEPIDGVACWKLQSTPKEAKSSQYTRSIVWIRKDRYTFERFENYIKDQVVRRLTYSDYQNVQGIWTARQTEMADLRRGSRTRLTLDKLAYNIPLKEEAFTLQALRRQ